MMETQTRRKFWSSAADA